MKHPTLDYINELRQAILARTDRINHLVNMVEEIRSCYKAMAPNQLNEAIRDVVGMQKEIAEHREFLKKAQKEVDEYFASPCVA